MEYRIVKRRKTKKYVIVDKKGKAISQEFDRIFEVGLINGKSIYYIAEKDGKRAIFDKNGKRITKKWYDWISLNGLIDGEGYL